MNYNWLTPRDQAVYDYLKHNAKYVTTSQLAEIFFMKNEKGDIKNPRLICRRRSHLCVRSLSFTSFPHSISDPTPHTLRFLSVAPVNGVTVFAGCVARFR